MVEIESNGRQPFLGCVMSYSPNQICINRINSFQLFILILFAFLLILLLKIDDFEKSLYNLQ